MVAKKAGVKQYKVFYATQDALEQSLRLYKKELQSAFDQLLAATANGQPTPVANIVETLIEYGIDAGASDIHVEPLREATIVRFRIDGVLHDEVRLPKAMHAQIIARIKVLARLRTDEHFSAQDGRMQTKVGDVVVDVRVSIVPVVTGEKTVLRLLASHFRQFGLTDLGMGQADLKKVQAGFARPYGMVLSTGPTGSGKTTSMYAVLKILNTRDKNIATIEDPVEYEIGGINQIQANPKTNLTFAEGLRSLLRQDPDIMYVGEIRDQETAGIAVNAAMTGHLVLSTMHTNDAATTLPRLIDMGVEPFLIASTVNVIIGQRLVRQICTHCKASIELTRTAQGWQGDARQTALLASINAAAITKHFGSKKTIRVYQGTGCAICHETGYQGRIGIFEVLEVSQDIATLITAKANADAIMVQAIQEGMTTMLDDGLDKVMQGATTLEEILRVTQQ
jgi:type II secretory ATPase GspE/PulE/Tfp pilus assembly ATPase PilB-like protein